MQICQYTSVEARLSSKICLCVVLKGSAKHFSRYTCSRYNFKSELGINWEESYQHRSPWMDASRLARGEFLLGTTRCPRGLLSIMPLILLSRTLFAYSGLVTPAKQCQLLRDQVQSRLHTEKQTLMKLAQAALLPRSHETGPCPWQPERGVPTCFC